MKSTGVKHGFELVASLRRPGGARAEIDGGGQVVIGGVAPAWLTCERRPRPLEKHLSRCH